MKFSVVGLPHYTIWHLYEPSVDDIRHMEEMEQEKQKKEAEEAANKERMNKIKDTFDSPSRQWEKDKSEVQNLAAKEKEPAAQDAPKKVAEMVKKEAAKKDKIVDASGEGEQK